LIDAEVDVRMGEGGGQPDADNSGKGGGKLKITNFCIHPLWTAPNQLKKCIQCVSWQPQGWLCDLRICLYNGIH